MTDTTKRLVLIDAFSQIYRGFHAVPELTNHRGEPTNAVLAFARFLLTVDSTLEHSHGAVVFDKGPPAERLAILPEYKANRPPVPEKLQQQIPVIKEWISAAGWAIIEKEETEADDLIAAVSLVGENLEVWIISADKDLAQLVDDKRVVQLVPAKNKQFHKLDSGEVESKFGIKPEQIVDYLAMLGDASDNITGVQGIGEKTATALLRQFGTVENMLNNLGALKGEKIRDTLARSSEKLRRNRELIQLKSELPPDWQGVQSLKRRNPDYDKLVKLAEDYNLKSLINSLKQQRKEDRSPSLF